MKQTKIDRPIFIVGAGHSGTTFLGRILRQHPDLMTWEETNRIWTWGNVFRKSDILNREDLTPKIKNHILNHYEKFSQRTGNRRICDKTPRNCLRIPFVLAVFPDAKIIHLIRDGRAVMNSTQKSYTKSISQYEVKNKLQRALEIPIWQWYVFLPRLPLMIKRLLGIRLKYWGEKPSGWSEWESTLSPTQLLAKQWVEIVQTAITEGRKVSAANYLEIFYEDLINQPEATMKKIAAFAELENSGSIIDYCQKRANPSINSKWKKTFSPQDLEEVGVILAPMMKNLGYEW